MLSSQDAAELLEPLIEGMVEDPLWSTFLHRLRARLRADYVSLTFRPLPFGTPQNRVIHLYSGRRTPPVLTQKYRDSLYKVDPLPYHDLEDGRLYRLAELLQFGDPVHEAYREQLLAPSGMNVMRMMRVREASGISGWLTVSRESEEFAAGDDALLAALAPFLRAALRSYVALEQARMAAHVAGDAIRRMNFGWIALDAEGRIIESDSHGAGVLSPPGLLSRDRDGRLTARRAGLAREIAAAVSDLLANPDARPRAIVLSREPWLDLLLVASPARVGTTRPAPAIVAYVHSDNWSSADRCEQLGELFDLAPSEARLALALSRGMSIAEAAGELGLTVESARTYSKRIYAKTGARGQADLVRFIHRSVLAIA